MHTEICDWWGWQLKKVKCVGRCMSPRTESLSTSNASRNRCIDWTKK
jgi:hypothetical protein